MTYHECVVDNDGAWCSTEVDDDGVHVGNQGNWGICGPGCPTLPPGTIIAIFIITRTKKIMFDGEIYINIF